MSAVELCCPLSISTSPSPLGFGWLASIGQPSTRRLLTRLLAARLLEHDQTTEGDAASERGTTPPITSTHE